MSVSNLVSSNLCGNVSASVSKTEMTITSEEALTYIRTYIVNNPTLCLCKKEPCELRLTVKEDLVKRFIIQFINIKYSFELDKGMSQFIFTDTNAVDFLSKIFDNSCTKFPDVKMFGLDNIPYCKIKREDKDAIFPAKKFASDEGYDLTLIKVSKVISPTIVRYDTGLAIQPKLGYHAEIYPRSSLGDSGYMLSNSIGLIDSSYRGTLKITLIKVDASAKDIELPFRAVQLVLKKNQHYLLNEVDQLNDTTRASGGFGSTNATK